MTILLAEDDSATREVLAAQLRKLGNTVYCAPDGEEGWALFEMRKPDVVITDWMMPHVDGLEFSRRIRSAGHPAYTYIIILTALDRNVGYIEGMGAGADDFMTKPCDIVELTMRLRAAERVLALQREVDQLEHLLPICPRCKRIRDEQDRWLPVEAYVSRMTDAQFSHGVCPACYEKFLKPQLDAARKRAGTTSN